MLHPAPSPAPLFQPLLSAANVTLLLSFVLFGASVLICYPFEALFSLPQLVAAHLLLIASATLIKLSYVCRCIALYGLQREVC